MMRTPEISLQQKKAALNAAVGNVCTVLPLLFFQVSTNFNINICITPRINRLVDLETLSPM